MQSSNGDTDIENRLVDMAVGRKERLRYMERVIWKLTLLHDSGNSSRGPVTI